MRNSLPRLQNATRLSRLAIAPHTPIGSKHEPVPAVTSQVPPLTLLLAQDEAEPTQTTVIRHEAKWRIPKDP